MAGWIEMPLAIGIVLCPDLFVLNVVGPQNCDCA